MIYANQKILKVPEGENNPLENRCFVLTNFFLKNLDLGYIRHFHTPELIKTDQVVLDS